ncbi:hypothetical protein SAMN02799642_05035, partial [Methylobacterium brachiatum]
TPCSRQNVASSAWPSGVLATCRHGPWRPMRASSVAAPTSTPQMMSVTVTCLVHATGCRATVRSCVTRRPPVPKLSHGCGLRGDGRQRPRARVGGHRPSRSPHLTIPKGRPPDTRGSATQQDFTSVAPSPDTALPSPDPLRGPPSPAEGGGKGRVNREPDAPPSHKKSGPRRVNRVGVGEGGGSLHGRPPACRRRAGPTRPSPAAKPGLPEDCASHPPSSSRARTDTIRKSRGSH